MSTIVERGEMTETKETGTEFVERMVENYAADIIVRVLGHHVMGQCVSKENLARMTLDVKASLYSFGATMAHRTYVEMLEGGYTKKGVDK